ncbi:TonB family protein [Hydrogenophaga sp. NFH-34]|uniref:TonB family protein n=1 Tax=Hydrogenophaga sp. NFH-34 TaxID=2744446 RepID=UPI001F2F2A4D|nr:TonB family protein [Hydrogenophaga sp. NFH-34]
MTVIRSKGRLLVMSRRLLLLALLSPWATQAGNLTDMPLGQNASAVPADPSDEQAAQARAAKTVRATKSLPGLPENADLIPVFEAQEGKVKPFGSFAVPKTRASLTHQGMSVYPRLAQDANLSGQVSVMVYIDVRGAPYKTAVVSRQPSHLYFFDDAARLAAMQSRFEPARNDQGEVVEDARIMPIVFTAADGAAPAQCRLDNHIAVEYPQAAREQGIETRMLMAVPVNPSGQVDAKGVVILSRGAQPTGLFDDSARHAASNARCSPSVRDGQPIDGWGIIEVEYALTQKARRAPPVLPPNSPIKNVHSGELPSYPEFARRAGLEGSVLMEVDIHWKSGKPLATRIVDRKPYYMVFFDETARRWAMELRQVPELLPLAEQAESPDQNGFTTIAVPINFKLDRDRQDHSQVRCDLTQVANPPDTARILGKEARVLVAVSVDERGRIQKDRSKVAYSLPADAVIFHDNAIATANQARCKPSSFRGVNVPGFTFIEVPFTLRPSVIVETGDTQ